MKKSLRNSILLLLTAMLLTVSALADSGPKAQLTVKVENAPSEPYYLDLLEKGDYQGHTYGSGDGDDTYSGLDWSYSEEEIAALDDELLDALRAAVPEGWQILCLSITSICMFSNRWFKMCNTFLWHAGLNRSYNDVLWRSFRLSHGNKRDCNHS